MRNYTIYSDQLSQPYVRRMAEIVTDRFAGIKFEPWGPLGWRIIFAPRPAAIQVQWFDVILRRKSKALTLSGILKMILFLSLLRLFGIRVVVIFHNPAGKGHDRIGLDRCLRSFLVLVGSAFVVLNSDAIGVVSSEVLRPSRGRFGRRVVVVPHPYRIVDHRSVASKADARDRLGLDVSAPLVVHVPGANQAPVEGSLIDESGRYELLTLERGKAPLTIVRESSRYIARGKVSDEEFGLLIKAADALLLTDSRAFGSATLHAAVDLGTPVISPPSPSVSELAELGGAVLLPESISPDSIAFAIDEIDSRELRDAFLEFERRHSDMVVASAAERVMRKLGWFELRVSSDVST